MRFDQISKGWACVAAGFLAAAAWPAGAQAAFVTYDDFNGTSLDPAKFVTLTGSTAPTVSGGVATFRAGFTDFIRSTQSFPLGSTIRYELTSLSSADNFILGTTSQTNDGIFNSDDSTYARDDGGNTVYAEGVAQTTAVAVPATGASTLDFFFGTDGITITQTTSAGTTTLYTGPTPSGFNENQRAELGVYGNGTFVVDRVLVEVVPEPGSLALLGITGAGMLARRRRS